MGNIHWKLRRRKPWRRIRTKGEKIIRRCCLAALILEAAWGIRTYGSPEISKEYEMLEENPNPGGRKSIYGITIQWEEGQLRIYRQEEYWE